MGIVAVSLLSAGATASGTARPQRAATSAGLRPRVIAAAMRLPGTVVRRTPGVRVSSVDVPARLSTPGLTQVYRVRVAGRFPPRALRYQLLADGRPV